MGGLTRLLTFLNSLTKRNIPFVLGSFRDDTIMVSFALFGERYEVDFFEDNEEYCIFVGDEGPSGDLTPVHRAIEAWQ